MSIVLYLPHLRCGGAEISVVRLAEGLAARGLATRLVIHKAERDGTWLDPKVEVVELASARSTGALPHLARFLRRERPGVLLSALTHNNLIAVAAASLAGGRTKVVVSEHAPVSHQVTLHGGWRYRALPHLLPMLYAQAHAVVAVSQGVAADLTALGCAHPRLEVVPNPVLPPGWEALAEESPADPWFAPGQPPVVLAAGRLNPEKDFATLIEAVAHLRRRRPARLMILGEGPERAALESRAAELGLGADFRLPGTISNPFAYMRRAAAFALTSRHEGFGNVLVEALACGAPVVSTDCPVGPREILGDGRWGRLVPVGDPLALAEALEHALAKGSDTEAGRRRARDFTAQASVDGYLRVFGGA